MRNTFWNKKIPTLLGIASIIAGIAITTLLVQTGSALIIKAGPSETPKNIRITNVSDASITISYTTDALVIGSLNFGKDKNFGLIGLDDRDQQGALAPHLVHHITLKSLSPQTSYFFEISSGQNTFLNNGIPFEAKTGHLLDDMPSSEYPITGNAVLPDGTKPKEGIVYVTAENAQTLSALLKENGNFILPLSSLRTANFSSYFPFSKNTTLNILAENGSLSSHLFFSPKETNSVPTITLSSDYDFTTPNTPAASASGRSSGFPSFSAQEVLKNPSPEISIPKKDQGFSDQQPQFRGTATPLEKVQITIHSVENIQTEVTADKLGNWTYRPVTALSPGPHSVSITTKNPFGILKTITQSFTVFAQGSQVSQSATPSASTVPSPTPIPTVKPTVIPTVMPTPTSLPSIFPSAIPTVEPKPALPATGSSFFLPIGATAIGTALVGIVIFFLTHGVPL